MAEEERKILGADYAPHDGFHVRVGMDEPGNPRLRVNVPADQAFVEVVAGGEAPPYLIVTVRADKEIMAYGVLEKARQMVQAFAFKHDTKSQLAAGVEAAAKKLMLPTGSS